MDEKKTLKISAIRDGTVIDHIPAEHTFKVADILNLRNSKDVISVGANLQSRRLGSKGLIKIGGRELTAEEVGKIALVAPKANLNTIKNFEVVKKATVEIPERMENLIRCANSRCVTNAEAVKTKFFLISKVPLKVRCAYCERILDRNDIELL